MSDRGSVQGSSVDCLKVPGSQNGCLSLESSSTDLKDLKNFRHSSVSSLNNLDLGLHRLKGELGHFERQVNRSENYLNRPENYLNRPEKELEPTNLQHYAQGLYFVQK